MNINELDSVREELNLIYVKIAGAKTPEECAHIYEENYSRIEELEKILCPNLSCVTTDVDESQCPVCLGTMTYCEGCRMWSSTCCEEFGTCMCS